MNKTQAGMGKNSYSILVLILMLSLLLIWLWLMVLLLLLVLAFNLFYNSSQHKKWPQNFNFFLRPSPVLTDCISIHSHTHTYIHTSIYTYTTPPINGSVKLGLPVSTCPAYLRSKAESPWK